MADAAVAERRRPGRDDARDHRRPRPAREGAGPAGTRARASGSTRAASAASTPARPMWCSVNPGIRDPELAELVPADDSRDGSSWSAAGSPGWRPRAVPRCAGTASCSSSGAASSAAGPASPGRGSGRERWALLHRLAARRGRSRRRRAAHRRRGDGAGRPRRRAGRGRSSRRGHGSAPPPRSPGPVPVVDVDALLEHGPPEVRTRSALVLDDEGGFLAPTAAERLVAEGFSVEIATTHPVVGAEIDPTQQPFVFRRPRARRRRHDAAPQRRRERRRRRHPAQHLHRAR